MVRKAMLRAAMVVAWVSLTACPPVGAEESPREDEYGFAFHEFAGDLFTPWSEVAPYPATYYGGDYFYQPVVALPKTLQAQVTAVVPGWTRERLERSGWSENGGPTVIEFLLMVRRGVVDHPEGRARYVALRIALRPGEMSAEVYADPAQRRIWLREHRPGLAPNDVITRVSRPYLAVLIAD